MLRRTPRTISQSVFFFDSGVTIDNEIKAPQQENVQADIDRLKQAIGGVLKNAVQYNKRNGSVSVRLKDADEKRLRIEVQDSGVGIEAALLEKIFEPFERGKAYELGIDGAGVGLTLAKHLLESMGGSIGAASEPGKGSLFWLELPRSAA